MLHPDLPYQQFTVKPNNKLEEDLYSGSIAKDAFVVAYISKMFAVPTDALPQHQRKPLSAEEMRERGRASREAAAALAVTGVVLTERAEHFEKSSENRSPGSMDSKQPELDVAASSQDGGEETLLGFARLYSGTMRTGQVLYAILPKYNTALSPVHARNNKFIIPVRIEYLYMMMGRDLVTVDEVPAGNVFAVGGLAGKIPRNGTLCGFGTRDAGLEPAAMESDKDCFVNLAGLRAMVCFYRLKALTCEC